MARNIDEFIKQNFDNELWCEVEKYLKDNKIHLRVRKLKAQGEFELIDLEQIRVDVYDLPNDMIQFNVVMDATLEVKDELFRYNDETEIVHQWFMINCVGSLSCKLADMKIIKTTLDSSKEKNLNPLSNTLVPIISKKDLEKTATKFLEKYYIEALKEPIAIDPIELAKRMKLKVDTKKITKDMSVFGQLYFKNCDTIMCEKNEMIAEGTILVDSNFAIQRSEGAFNNTIVHECVHWDMHKKAFMLEELYNDKIDSIKCRVDGGIVNSKSEATKWMEWQANQLTPRIQMPLLNFKMKVHELLASFKKIYSDYDLCDLMPRLISELSAFYKVSKVAAKLRLIDIGYEEAIGSYVYVDGHYVKPHCFSKNSLKRNQTFTLSKQDAAALRYFNETLRELTSAGDYIFVENHYVYNVPLYVTKVNDEIILTDYARHHMDECCLIFDMNIEVENQCIDPMYFFANREKYISKIKVEFNSGYKNAPPQKQKEMREKIKNEEWEIRNKITNDTEQAMKTVLDWNDMTYQALEDVTGVSRKNFERMAKGETAPKFKTLAIACLALNLPPIVTNRMFEAYGLQMQPRNQEDQWIMDSLYTMHQSPYHEVAAKLEEVGVYLNKD